MPLVTAGSGVAIGLPANFGIQAVGSAGCAAGRRRRRRRSCPAVARRPPTGRCRPSSTAAARHSPSIHCASPQAKTWSRRRWPGRRRCCRKGPVLVYSTARADAVKAVQGRLGAQQAGALVEQAIAAIARGPGRARRAAAGGGRRRDLGRLRAGAGRSTQLQIGAADRRRACPGARAATARAVPCISR